MKNCSSRSVLLYIHREPVRDEQKSAVCIFLVFIPFHYQWGLWRFNGLVLLSVDFNSMLSTPLPLSKLGTPVSCTRCSVDAVTKTTCSMTIFCRCSNKTNMFNDKWLFWRCYNKSNMFNDKRLFWRCYNKSNMFNDKWLYSVGAATQHVQWQMTIFCRCCNTTCSVTNDYIL